MLRLKLSYSRKSIHQKLQELYIEETGKQTDVKVCRVTFSYRSNAKICTPNLTICTLNQTKCMPSQTICMPNQTICMPNQRICMPNQTICMPNQTLCMLNQTICMYAKWCHPLYTV